MAEVDMTRVQDLRAGVPGVHLPPAGNLRIGSVAPEHGTTHRRPPRTPGRAGREAPASETQDADPSALAEQLEDLNRKAKPRCLRFELSGPPEGLVVQVIDARTEAVLRTIPAAPPARLRERLLSAIGLVVDARL